MPEEKKVDEAVETTETKSTEESETTTEETKTVADEIAETLAKPDEEPVEGEAETSEPLAEESKEEPKESTEETLPAEKTDDVTEEVSEDETASSFLEDATVKKTGLEKRVDKLTAEKYKKDTEIAELKERVTELELALEEVLLVAVRYPKVWDTINKVLKALQKD